jgi:adenosylmethionine---8-amino-7-oxononanoate aminotransferase
MKTGNKGLFEIDKNHVWHPFTSFGDKENIHITRAEGLYLYSNDGRKIMDAISSWWVNLHGHSNPQIAKAISKQALTLEHVIFAGFSHEPAITLAKNLLSVLPENQERIFFSDNGSTAVEVAVKMALQYWFNQNIPKRKIIALSGSYHGDTFGSMSVGARSAFSAPFEPYLFDVEFIDVPDAHNYKSVLDKFQILCSSGSVAAFIYEPLVQGAAGMIMYAANYLDGLLKSAKEHNVVCIADEVFTGFGRTGKWFASEYMVNIPDILAVSKGITGGSLPLGVTSCSGKIADAFSSDDPNHTFFHGHSYTANPISCAAANASFEILSSDATWEKIRAIENSHFEFSKKLRGHKKIRDIRFRGTILAIEIATDQNTSYFNHLKKRIYTFFLERNILLRPLGNIIYIVPPYIIESGELKIIYSAIEEFLATNAE